MNFVEFNTTTTCPVLSSTAKALVGQLSTQAIFYSKVKLSISSSLMRISGSKISAVKDSAVDVAQRAMDFFTAKKEVVKEKTSETADEAKIKYEETEDEARRKMEEKKLGENKNVGAVMKVQSDGYQWYHQPPNHLKCAHILISKTNTDDYAHTAVLLETKDNSTPLKKSDAARGVKIFKVGEDKSPHTILDCTTIDTQILAPASDLLRMGM